MPYLGRPVTNAGQFEIIDDISSGFNGSEKSFTLQVGGTDIQPDVANVTITLGGVFQVPSSAYSITGSAINFSEAPESNTTFHGVLEGQTQFIESDFITNTMIKSTAAISGSKIDTDFSAQSFQLTNVTASGDISGSGVSTGSFGKVEVGSGKITTTGNMVLDADGAQIRLEDGGTEFGRISRVSSDLVIKSISNNNDILFKGVDGSSTITALQLDMSEAGNAIFNNDVTIAGTLTAQEFHTEFTSASILFSSGSTLFGDSSDDVHEFRGNLISGSATSTASLAMISLADKIEHIGDTNNTIEFGTDEIKLRTGGSSRLIARDANVELYNNLIVAGTISGSDDITLDNNKYYQVKATGGSAIRIAGLANDNNIYLGAIDDAGGSVYIREDGSNVLSFTGGKASFSNAVTSSLLLVEGVSNYTGIEVKGSGASRPQVKFTNVNQGTLGQIYGTEGNDLSIVAADDIILDATGEHIHLDDGGTRIGNIDMGSQNLTLRSSQQDKDIIFRGQDGASEIAALTLDMSEAGKATFNAGVVLDSSSDQLSRYDEGEATIYMYTNNGTKDNAAWANRSGYTKMSYIRVGDIVTCQGKFEFSGQGNASTDSNDYVLFELPFTVYDGTDRAGDCAGPISINRASHGLTTSTMNGWVLSTIEGSTSAYIFSPSLTSATEQYLKGFSDGTWEGHFQLTYRTQ